MIAAAEIPNQTASQLPEHGVAPSDYLVSTLKFFDGVIDRLRLPFQPAPVKRFRHNSGE